MKIDKDKFEFIKEHTRKTEREYTFVIYEDERPTLEEWYKTHKCKYTEDPLKVGAIGGRLSYTFTPTGLGNITVIKCLCGAEINITNYDNW